VLTAPGTEWLQPVAVIALVLYVTFMISTGVILTMRRRRLDAAVAPEGEPSDSSPPGLEDERAQQPAD
jgi:flagellar biosynthesis/type III secretory pathway M-ring protein FliF/YscJ